MPSTAVNALPFPEDKDAPDGPVQIKALADALDVLKWGSRNLKPTSGVLQATGNQALTNSFVNVTSAEATLTPAVASILEVYAVFAVGANAGEAQTAGWGEGTLRLDSVDQTPVARGKWLNDLGAQAVSGATCMQFYRLALTAAEHTLKMRVKGVNGFLISADTRALYTLFAS